MSSKCKVKIGLITGRAASYIVRDVTKKEECVDIIVLPVNVVSLLNVELIKKMIVKNDEILSALKNSNIVIIPGLVKGDASELSKILNKPVYKGTKSAAGIPYILKYLREGGKLDTLKPADEILSKPPERVSYEEAFKIGNVSVSLRGPPLRIISEIPPHIKDENINPTVSELIEENTDIILIGSNNNWGVNKISKRVKKVEKHLEEKGLEIPLGIEVPSLDVLKDSLNLNVDLLYVPASLLQERLSLDLSSKVALILADRDLTLLEKVMNFFLEIGIDKVALDPVLDLPLFGLTDSLARHKRCLRFKRPILFSAANVVEEIEADTHGLHALLATIAVELGASLYSIVIDSYKSIHEVSEAREALRLASEAWKGGETERGFYSKLLIVKQSLPPPPARLPPGEKVKPSGPILDKAGYFVIDVDHKRNVIVVEFRGIKTSFRLESNDGLSLAREAVRRTNISKEHAVYLGYELHKAELALKLGKTYSQDEPLLEVPWEDDNT